MLIKQQKIVPGRRWIDQEPRAINQALTAVIRQEAEALLVIANNLPTNAWQLIDKIMAVPGKVVFSGVGKSGLIAQKLAATWSSLGIPAFFVHPTDALHGDLGVIQKNDFFIALSKSGTSAEFEFILPIMAARGVSTVLWCCSRGVLADKVDMVITLPLDKEACQFNLAPTSSSTAMMAFGDALAVVMSSMRGFEKQDFARNHPAGALGRRLLLSVGALMHKGDVLPFLKPTSPFKDLLVTITTQKLGIGIVVDEQHHLMGIITDGDLRRACEQGPAIFEKTAVDLMTCNPKMITPDILAYVALETMEAFNITSLVVVEQDKVVGLVHIHDLIKAGIRG